jgi:hypothetical protein
MTYGRESTKELKRLIIETQKAWEKWQKTGDDKDWKDYSVKLDLQVKERDSLSKKILGI